MQLLLGEVSNAGAMHFAGQDRTHAVATRRLAPVDSAESSMPPLDRTDQELDVRSARKKARLELGARGGPEAARSGWGRNQARLPEAHCSGRVAG
jgi:hypothetical protein